MGDLQLGFILAVILDQFPRQALLVLLHFCASVNIIRIGSDLKVCEGIVFCGYL